MQIRRYETNSRMSQAVVYGGFAFLAGQVAVDAPNASIAEQTRNVLERIDGLLTKVGTTRSRILSATIWLTDISTFDEINAVWDAWVPAASAPARATVEARLAAPKYGVEIGIIAAVGD
ncbi:RidA family protein [Mesorhizobium sp. LHD-90]|uniref:RidA family protein n=1 Tax=Mesorhizobium sp. LHD-90 TaxID=3071414 RepID=UPI0027DEF1AC|nr:RidA family protein [Mesorhizobium sp. LHD-90]MDQ6433915.1 RidA family protein [Mesorhizobium sp. LHD-90]